MKIRPKEKDELCNCEICKDNHGHDQGCCKLAGNIYVDGLGYVCDECAKMYPDEYLIDTESEPDQEEPQ